MFWGKVGTPQREESEEKESQWFAIAFQFQKANYDHKLGHLFL